MANDESPLTEIRRTAVDPQLVNAFKRERQHLVLASDLLRECAQWTVILGSGRRGELEPWDTREAILAGHLVRLSKLLRALLLNAKDQEGELAWIALRITTECIINLRFLLSNLSDELLRSYLHYSLQHERALQWIIERNIRERGHRLPIEERMMRSIARTFRNSQVLQDDLPRPRIRNWANRTLREKAESLGLEEPYKLLVAGASRNVHGDWQDLLQHHLTVKAPGQFEPRFEEATVRPQAFYAIAVLAIPALIEYVRFLNVAESGEFESRLAELDTRVRVADALHEQYLVGRSEARESDRHDP
jgi:hypothetical protein